MEQVLLYCSYVCFVGGSFFILSSALGMLRMRDFFSRLHPSGMSDSIGLPLILLGIMLQTEFGLVTFKILLIIVFSMLTSATSCHALSKSALLSGLVPLGDNEPRAKKKPVAKKAAPKKTKGKA
jgi:multicomponent Na+:H+ antiporter subunit G